MSRVLSLLAAFTLALACLPAAAEQPVTPVAALGGTSWLSEEGWLYTFSGNGMVFFSGPMYPSYVQTAPWMFVPIRAIAADGYIIDPNDSPYVILHDGDTLTLQQSTPDGIVTLTFSPVDNTAALAGTRWQNEHGDVFEFNADCTEFSCWRNAHYFSRTQSSLGAYYEMTIGMDGERYYAPSAPYAFRLENGTLYVYTVQGRLSLLWQTFTPVAE